MRFWKSLEDARDVNQSYGWRWNSFSIPLASKKLAFSFEVQSKWPLHSASLVLKKKVTATGWEVGSCHVPLFQVGFVLKSLNDFKVGNFGWHVSQWVDALIANLGWTAELGVFFGCTTREGRLLALVGCCFDRRASNTSHFWEYREVWKENRPAFTHLHAMCLSAGLLTHTDGHYVATLDATDRWIAVALLSWVI